MKYFSSPSSSLCYAVDEDTPSWITTFFADFTECCKVGWKFDECLAAAPFNLAEEDTEDEESTSTTTSTTSSSTTIMQFYSSPSDGMCAILDGNTPSWINTFFVDWSECCKAGWKFDECMAAAPFNLAGEETEDKESTSTTTSTTIIADVKYYSVPSNGMCAIVDEKTPSWINTFFNDWEECCKVGWVYSKCIEERPA